MTLLPSLLLLLLGSSSNLTRQQSTRRYDGSVKEIITPATKSIGISTLLSHTLKHNDTWINFYILYSLFLFIPPIIGGGIIANISNISYLDGFYFTVSAQTCTGLNPVPMYHLSTGAFVILALHMCFGSSFWYMNIWPSLGKYYYMRQFTKTKKIVDIKEEQIFNLSYQTMEANLFIMISYCLLWQSFTLLALIGMNIIITIIIIIIIITNVITITNNRSISNTS